MIAELNYSMCRPMNRKGVVCSGCMDGYGPSFTSYGYRCVKCADAWYRKPPLLIYELLPITVFYVIVLVFRISVTNLLLPFLALLCMPSLLPFSSDTLSINSYISGTVFMDKTQVDNVMQTLYGIFNLDFFSPILFCVSSKLQLIHIIFLGYISIFYPQFSIF